MPNPQQPELRRSERVPALDPDATEAKLTAERKLREPTDPRAPVPEHQRPGHHPDQDQDKPDMDAFAARLGVVSDEDEPEGAPHVEDDKTPADAVARSAGRRSRQQSSGPSWSPIGLMLVGPVTGFLVVKGALKALKRFRG